MSKQVNASTQSTTWTSTQAYVLAVICLLVGVAAGYFLRGSSTAETAATTNPAAAMPAGGMPQVSPEQLAAMAQKQAGPLLETLKNNPNDAALLAQIGDIYYDTQQYKDAVGYYEKSLKVRPENPDVRADLATCYWYQGDPDTAIAQYEKTLSYNPSHAGALFNLGIVRWQGKMDPAGAVQAWETLLKTNPNYRDKARVLELIARAKQHATGNLKGAPKS